jgi:hyperosmotically inducible protein
MMQSLSMPRLLAALLLAVSLFGVPACKAKNRDADIQTAINNKTQSDPNLAGVSATVVEGTVTLSGTCADEPCRQNAEKSVKDIDGVKKVVNNITVAPVTVSPDAQLQTSLQDVVSRYEGVQASVANGVVTLRGQVARDRLQNLMQDVNALRPQRIDNQLVIK